VGGVELGLLLQGAWTTAWMSLIAIAIGVPLGLVLALVRAARVPVIGRAVAVYVSLGRATPLVTLVLFVYLGLPSLGLDIDAVTAGVLSLTLNTACFHSEVWRASLQSLPRQQIESAKAVGMTPPVAFRRIVLPQVTLTSLPGLVNEITLLVKASPAIAVIGIVDLTRVTNRIAAVTYEPLPPILAACVLYMLLIGGLVRLQRRFDGLAMRLTG
jgi:polar amino acid transport system permease protein